MGDKISEISEAVKKKLAEIKTLQELQDLKVKYLGKKGEITSMLKGLRGNDTRGEACFWAESESFERRIGKCNG